MSRTKLRFLRTHGPAKPARLVSESNGWRPRKGTTGKIIRWLYKLGDELFGKGLVFDEDGGNVTIV